MNPLGLILFSMKIQNHPEILYRHLYNKNSLKMELSPNQDPKTLTYAFSSPLVQTNEESQEPYESREELPAPTVQVC